MGRKKLTNCEKLRNANFKVSYNEGIIKGFQRGTNKNKDSYEFAKRNLPRFKRELKKLEKITKNCE